MEPKQEKEFNDSSHVEELSPVQSKEDVDVDEVYNRAEQRAIIHRIDRRLVSMTGLMYCVSLMDRTNLSNAIIAGMRTELRLDIGFRYGIIALIFFVPYVLFQPPATVLTRKIGPRIFLSSIALAWSVVMIGFGFVDSWSTLAGLRVLLGALEAGFFPGSVYLLSAWYVRYDVQKRYSVFYLIGCFAAACAGILAFGFMQMRGLAGKDGWRWIFIMEGIISCLVALLGFWLLVDFPETAHKAWRFLSREECAFVIRRVDRDRGDAVAEPFTYGRFLRPAGDWKIWCFALIFLYVDARAPLYPSPGLRSRRPSCVTTVTYSIAFFLPVILVDRMRFGVGAAQCLVAPPYAFAAIIMYSAAWLGDRYRTRAPIVAFNALLCIVGLPVMGYASSSAVAYFGVFLVTAGANANVPAVMAYQANNIRGQWKRAFCSASLVGFGGIGGIAGSLVFRTQDAPTYIPGVWACIAANLLILTLLGVLSLFFAHSNRKARKGEKIIEGQPGFRYTI